MTLCPVALAVGCRRCPVFSICPATRVLGDQAKTEGEPPVVRARKKTPIGKRKA